MKPTVLITLATLAIAATAHAGGRHQSAVCADPAVEEPILADPRAPAYQDEPGYRDAWYARCYAEHDPCKRCHQ